MLHITHMFVFHYFFGHTLASVGIVWNSNTVYTVTTAGAGITLVILARFNMFGNNSVIQSNSRTG